MNDPYWWGLFCWNQSCFYVPTWGVFVVAAGAIGLVVRIWRRR